MTTPAADHCTVKVYVHFLDLYKAIVPSLSTNYGDGCWKQYDAISNALLTGVTSCNEVCLDHQVWLTIEPETDDAVENLSYIMERTRREIEEVLTKHWK